MWKRRKQEKTTYADDCTEFTHGHLLRSVHSRSHLLLVLRTVVVVVMVKRVQMSWGEVRKNEIVVKSKSIAN